MNGNGASAKQTPRSQAVAQSPLRALPPHRATKQLSGLPHSSDFPRLHHIQLTGAFYREPKQLYIIHRNKHREAAKLRRQRNMAQMKKQKKKPPGKELNEMEITNLSDAEFKTLVIRMLK